MQFRRLSFALGMTSALAMAGAGVVMAQGTSGGPAKPPQQNSIDPVSGSFEVNGVCQSEEWLKGIRAGCQ